MLDQLRKNLIHKRIEFVAQSTPLDTIVGQLYDQILIAINKISSESKSDINTIAFYWPIQHEPDLRSFLIEWRQQSPNHRLCLPVVTKNLPLKFYEWVPHETILVESFNSIMEPTNSTELSPDLIIAPCVGWQDSNAKLWRIGFGGGYYDRTLGNLHLRGLFPWHIGIAFDCQEVVLSDWQPQSLDQPLDALVTESRCLFNLNSKRF
ncbi:MAG: 5-formyltetrahydrofolate cyclo-ligase [Betaproteobacteria bacterium]|jgi:5,10-methenyltetrahydrofolate synthetase